MREQDQRQEYALYTTILFLLLVVFLSRCGPITPIPPNPYDPVEYCDAACNNLFKLGCPGWEGSPGEDEQFGTEDDISCVDVCKAVVEEPTATLHQKCTAEASSCEEVEACFVD